MSKSSLSYDGLKTWYEAMIVRYTTLNDGNTSIDNKLLAIIGASVAVVLVFLPELVNFEYFNVLLFAGCIGMAVTAVIAIVGSRVSDGSTPVHTHAERPDYYNKTDEAFIWQLIADLEDSIEKTTNTNESKSRWYWWSLSFFIASGLAIGLSKFISVCLN